MATLRELTFNTIMRNLCKDLNTEIDNLMPLLKIKTILSKRELNTIHNIAGTIIEKFSIKVNSVDNAYTLDIHGKETSVSINTALQHSTAVETRTRQLPSWMLSYRSKQTRKKLLKHFEVRDDFITKINAYAKALNTSPRCISSAYNILEIIKTIQEKS